MAPYAVVFVTRPGACQVYALAPFAFSTFTVEPIEYGITCSEATPRTIGGGASTSTSRNSTSRSCGRVVVAVCSTQSRRLPPAYSSQRTRSPATEMLVTPLPVEGPSRQSASVRRPSRYTPPVTRLQSSTCGPQCPGYRPERKATEKPLRASARTGPGLVTVRSVPAAEATDAAASRTTNVASALIAQMVPS